MISLAPLLAAIGCWVDPAGERVDEARLLTDFQVAAARFHEATSRLRVERSIIKQKRENDLHAVFLVDKDCESLQQFHTTERGDYGESVMVACGAGRFLVRKKSPVSSYLLAKKDAGEDSSRSLLKERLEVIDVPYVIGGWLSYRTDMPPASFRFTRAIRKGEAVEASPVIEADFELKWIRTGLTTEGSVKLDPSRQLAVLSSEYVARPIKPGQPTVSKSVEIQYTPDLGSIVPAKITWRSNKDCTFRDLMHVMRPG